MSWTDWTLLGLFILGFLLFLYGANTYNAVVGYSGVYLFIGSIAAYLIIYIYKELTKKKTALLKTRRGYCIFCLGTAGMVVNLRLFPLPA